MRAEKRAKKRLCSAVRMLSLKKIVSFNLSSAVQTINSKSSLFAKTQKRVERGTCFHISKSLVVRKGPSVSNTQVYSPAIGESRRTKGEEAIKKSGQDCCTNRMRKVGNNRKSDPCQYRWKTSSLFNSSVGSALLC